VLYDNDWIRIGGVVRGIASDVHDPDGWVWALLRSLDGSRTISQAVVDLHHLFPSTSEGEVRSAIEDLIQAGYVEDADEPPLEELTAADRERYGRGRALMSWMDLIPRRSSWDAQLCLRQARVTVVGMGGVGGAAALALATSGVGHVHCVDHDVVEMSNLNRQILFTERDLGRPKVEAATSRLREHNSAITVTGDQLAVSGPGLLGELAMGADVLLLAADQPPRIRSWANEACHATGTAWVSAGYHGPQVGVGLYRPGSGPCYDCVVTTEQRRHTALPRRPPGKTRPHAANAVSANVTGLLAAHATMSLITGVPALRANCQFGFNLVTLEDSVVLGPAAARPDCPTCGRIAS
jgi:molybdopterin-synthase adenylyltransferase